MTFQASLGNHHPLLCKTSMIIPKTHLSQFTITSLASRLMVNKLKIAVSTLVLHKFNKHGSIFHYAHKNCPINTGNSGTMLPRQQCPFKIYDCYKCHYIIHYYNLICNCSWPSSAHSNHEAYLIIFTTSRYRMREHFL